MRQHAMRSPASRRSNRKQVYSRVTVRCVAIHCSRDIHNCVSRRNVAQRIATRGPASYCEPAFTCKWTIASLHAGVGTFRRHLEEKLYAIFWTAVVTRALSAMFFLCDTAKIDCPFKRTIRTGLALVTVIRLCSVRGRADNAKQRIGTTSNGQLIRHPLE